VGALMAFFEAIIIHSFDFRNATYVAIHHHQTPVKKDLILLPMRATKTVCTFNNMFLLMNGPLFAILLQDPLIAGNSMCMGVCMYGNRDCVFYSRGGARLR